MGHLQIYACFNFNSLKCAPVPSNKLLLLLLLLLLSTQTSRWLKNVPRNVLGKFAKFGGHSLNGFEVIQFSRDGGNPSGLNRVNIILTRSHLKTEFMPLPTTDYESATVGHRTG